MNLTFFLTWKFDKIFSLKYKIYSSNKNLRCVLKKIDYCILIQFHIIKIQ